MPFQPGHAKSGGKTRGSRNKPKPIVLEPTDENRALVLMAPTADIKTPKAVMLSKMMMFDRLSDMMMDQAGRLTGVDKEEAIMASYKFAMAAVSCAKEAAPYIHARLIAMESREGAEERVPYVVRAPAVMVDSAAWQAAVGAAVLDIEAAQVPSGGQPAVSGVSTASTASDRPIEPVSAPVALVADQKTGRVTVMPPGPRVVQPAGTVEWLERVAAEKRRAGG